MIGEGRGADRSRHPGHRARVTPTSVDRTRPSLSVRVQVLKLEGKTVIAIEVPSARSPVGTSDGKYLRRALGGAGWPACVPLHFPEMQALLEAPDVHTRPGIRDRAMLHLCFAAGLRVSELLTLPASRWRLAVFPDSKAL